MVRSVLLARTGRIAAALLLSCWASDVSGQPGKPDEVWIVHVQLVGGNPHCDNGLRSAIAIKDNHLALASRATGKLHLSFAVPLKPDGSADAVTTFTPLASNTKDQARVEVPAGKGPRLVTFTTHRLNCRYRAVP